MKSAYQGRALWTAPRPRSRRFRPGWAIVGALVVVGGLWFARAPLSKTAPYRWLFNVREVDVNGTTYLAEADVRKAAGLDHPVDFLRADLDRARAKLLKHPRVEKATIARALPLRIVITVTERKPVAIVRAGRLLEADARGVILPPLVSGVVADVPLVSGIKVKDARPGKRIDDPDFARALRHLKALEAPEIALGRPISEIDVSDATTTIVTLAPDGADVWLPAEPPDVRPLSALRVVLADLESRGQKAARVDLRGEEVIAVRPIPAAAPADSTETKTAEPRRG